MKNAILRATLLGIVASASFSLTQAASLAATAPAPAQLTSASVCADKTAKADSRNAAGTETDPAKNDRFIFAGP